MILDSDRFIFSAISLIVNPCFRSIFIWLTSVCVQLYLCDMSFFLFSLNQGYCMNSVSSVTLAAFQSSGCSFMYLMNQGDTIVLRIDTEDILCVFKGIESGYFITETCEDGIRNRYRVKSIKKSKVVKNASVDAADEEE